MAFSGQQKIVNPNFASSFQQPEKEQRGGGFLSGLLPLVTGGIGTAVGTLGGPLGMAAGGAGGSAFGEWLRQQLTGEADDGIDKGNLVQEGLLGALPGVFKGAKVLRGIAKGTDTAADLVRAERGVEGARGATKVGRSLTEKASGIEPSGAPGDTAKMASRAEFMSQYKGTPRKQMALMDADMAAEGKKVKEILEAYPKPMSGRRVSQNFMAAVDEEAEMLSDLDISSPATIKKINARLARYGRKTNAKAINEQLSKAQSTAKRAQRKLNDPLGKTLTPAETAALVEKRIVDRMLGGIDEIAPHKQKMAQIFENYGGVAKAAKEKYRVPFINVNTSLPSQAAKGAQSYAGAAAQKAPSTFGIPGAIAGQTASRAAGSAFLGTPFVRGGESSGEPEQPGVSQDVVNDAQLEEILNKVQGPSQSNNSSNNPFSDRNQVQQEYLKALRAGDSQGAAAIIKGFETFGQQEDGAGSEKAQAALGIVDELESVFNQAGGAQGPVQGRVDRILSGVTGGAAGNQTSKAYQELRGGFTAQISKALGEVGVLTDKDRQYAMSLIPSVDDTPTTAQIKLDSLRRVLQAVGGSGANDTLQGYFPESIYSNQGV